MKRPTRIQKSEPPTVKKPEQKDKTTTHTQAENVCHRSWRYASAMELFFCLFAYGLPMLHPWKFASTRETENLPEGIDNGGLLKDRS